MAAYLSKAPQRTLRATTTRVTPMSSLTIDSRTLRLASVMFLSAGVLGAQQTTPPIATAVPATVVLPSSAADTSEVLLVARRADSVRTDKDRLLGERRDAETRWAALTDQEQRLKASIGEVKSAIDDAGNREKQAKKEKRDGDRIAAAADRKRLERALDLIAARYDLRRAQSEEARIERDHLDAAVRADDAELAIAERREQVLPDDATQRTAFQELTSRWLQALRARAARAYDVEDRRFKVVEAQIELLKRQRG